MAEPPVWRVKALPFRYTFQAQGNGRNATFSARAEGDLDCDNQSSIFEQVGAVDQNNQVEIRQLFRQNPLE